MEKRKLNLINPDFAKAIKVIKKHYQMIKGMEREVEINHAKYQHAVVVGDEIVAVIRESDEKASFSLKEDTLFGTSLAYTIKFRWAEGHSEDTRLLDLLKQVDGWGFYTVVGEDVTELSICFEDVFTVYVRDEDGDVYKINRDNKENIGDYSMLFEVDDEEVADIPDDKEDDDDDDDGEVFNFLS